MFRTCAPLFLLSVLLLCGCRERQATGTPENLKADYDRMKKECAEQKKELVRTWKQRMADKETKIIDLTAENAGLRQQLLTVKSALDEVPLIDAAKQRVVLWVHVVYWMIISVCILIFVILFWFHADLRERVRYYVMRQVPFVSSMENDND